MRRYYITGTQGTGKTTVAKELQKRGFTVFDTDTYGGLCYWKNKVTGEKVTSKTGDRKEWLELHQWYCNPSKLKGLLPEQNKGDIFFVGISENQPEYIDFFDKI